MVDQVDIGTYGPGKIVRFDDLTGMCDVQECQVIASVESVVVPLSEQLYFSIWGSNFDCSVQAVLPMLRAAPGFRQLKPESFSRLAERATLVKIPSNRLIFEEGDRIDSEQFGANYFMLVAGSIRVVKKLQIIGTNKEFTDKNVVIDKYALPQIDCSQGKDLVQKNSFSEHH